MKKHIRELSSQNVNRNTYDLFYFSEQGSATQFSMLCDARDLLVINASYVFEESFLKKYAEHTSDVHLHQINITGLKFLFEPLQSSDVSAFRLLETDFRRTLPDTSGQIRVVHFKPDALPAVIVLTADATLRQEMEHTKAKLVMPDAVRDLLGRLLEERPSAPIILHPIAETSTRPLVAR